MDILYFLGTALSFLTMAVLSARFPAMGVSLAFFFSTQEILPISIAGYTSSLAELSLLAFVAGSLFSWIRSSRTPSSPMVPLLVLEASILFSAFFCIHPLQSLFAGIRFFLYPATAFFIGEWFSQKDSPLLLPFYFLFFASSILQIQCNSSIIQGFFDDPYYFALFLMLLFPFALSAIRIQSNPWSKWMGVVLFGGILAAMLWINFPMGLFLFCFCLLVSLFFGFWQKKHLQFFLPLLIISLFWWKTWGTTLVEFMARIPWQSMMETVLLDLSIWAQHPLWGIGYHQLTPYLHSLDPTWPGTILSHHASLFLLLAETGLFGGMTFLWLLLSLLSHFHVNRKPESEEKWLYHASRIASWVLVLSSLTLPIHLHGATWCFLGILYGLQHDTIGGVQITESTIGDPHECH